VTAEARRTHAVLGALLVAIAGVVVFRIAPSRRENAPARALPSTPADVSPHRPPAEVAAPVASSVSRVPFDPEKGADLRPHLSGRLLFERAPLASAEVDVRLRFPQDFPPARELVVATDVAGRWRFVIPAAVVGANAVPDFVEFRVKDERGAVAKDAQHRAPRSLEPGENDVGDVVLSETMPLVSGRVVDDQGGAVPGAYVVLDARKPAAGAPPTATSDQLRALGECSSLTDEAGRFVVRGPPPEFACVVKAVKASHVPLAEDGADFELGADVLLRLRRVSVLTARFTYEGKTPPFRLLLRATSAGDGLGSETTTVLSGEARVKGLSAGVVRVDVLFFRTGEFALQEDEPLASLDIQLGAAGSAPDPRLNPFALDAYIRRVAVRAVDPEGRDVEFGALESIAGKKNYAVESTSLFGTGRLGSYKSTEARLFVRADTGADFTVSAGGFRPRRLCGVREDVTVRLKPGVRARFRFAGAPPPPSDGRVWVVDFFGASDDGASWSATAAEGDVFVLGGPGTVRAVARQGFLSRDRSSQTIVPAAFGLTEDERKGGVEVQVPDVADAGTIEIPAPR
jgi:hypothetical protein